MTIKKLSAIFLSIVMMLSVLSVAVSAAETIVPYERISVTVSDSNNATFRFVPEETKNYIVTSYATGDDDPYAYIETEYDTIMIDDDNAMNFAAKLEFEAGVEYIITIGAYSDDDVTFDIALECVHEWDEDTCVTCKKVCTHETKGTKFKTCVCGKVSKATIIELGETVDVAFNGLAPIIRKFVPEEDVAAVLYSDVVINGIMYDASVTIYNAAGEELAYNDDFNGSYNFVIWYEFEAGETYFIEVSTYYEDLSLEFSLVKAAHTADDGAEHDVVYTDYQSGTCQELSYTEGLYCADCDIYFAGHFEDGYGFCCDEDEDGLCDVCGDGTIYDDDDNDEDEDITEDEEITEDETTEGEDAGEITLKGFVAKIQEVIDFIRNLILKVFAALIYR